MRTLYTDKILLHVLALRISAARGELAEAPVPDHQIPATFRAKLVERDIRDLFPLIEAARRLAVRISCASHELPEAPTLQHHHPAAVLAVLFLCSFLQVGRIKIGQVDGIFFRKFAGIGIILVVGAACVERSVLTPLDYQWSTAQFALFIRRLLHALDVFHVLLRITEILLEFFVKLGERVGPLFLALFDFVELFF